VHPTPHGSKHAMLLEKNINQTANPSEAICATIATRTGENLCLVVMLPVLASNAKSPPARPTANGVDGIARPRIIVNHGILMEADHGTLIKPDFSNFNIVDDHLTLGFQPTKIDVLNQGLNAHQKKKSSATKIAFKNMNWNKILVFFFPNKIITAPRNRRIETTK
jgi:hypothetical protein